ncbi:hypothetical protein MMC29_008004, partial [Sticta canariensis]|nr:hypothetical protein [Sticta canariensis]
MASRMFPKEDYGISPWVPVRPLLVGDRGCSGTYLVEYPAGDGTYCFWEEKSNTVWRIVTPVKLEDLLACLYRADYDALYIDPLLPIMCG